MAQCRICGTEYLPFIDFGMMPISNNFLAENNFATEYFFHMKAGHCSVCSMVQLVDQPNPDMMFHENYAFFSGTSKHMQQHFADFAREIADRFLTNRTDPFVVEIGSNDGILIKNFANVGIRHLGVEPSANVAKVAEEKGICSLVKFFNTDTAREIRDKHGPADVLLAANCFCHIPTLHSVIEGISILLKEDGIVAFEDPYLGAVLRNTLFDQLYDEHVFLFSLASISYAFSQHGFELIDVRPLTTHGGSMRYYLARCGQYSPTPAIFQHQKQEELLGVRDPKTYQQFRINCEKIRDDLVLLLTQLKKDGKRVTGYAATSKSTTILNYGNIGPNLIEFIADTTPIKQGKYSPGKHIPILASEEFRTCYPDYAVLFAYNHMEEILAKEKDFTERGGKWILFVPDVHVKGDACKLQNLVDPANTIQPVSSKTIFPPGNQKATPRGGRVLFILDPEQGHATVITRGLRFAPLFQNSPWRAEFVSVRDTPESAIIEIAKHVDIVYLLKVSSLGLVKKLKTYTLAKVIFDLTDALWLPFFRNNGWQDLDSILQLSDALFSENDWVCAYGHKFNSNVVSIPVCTLVEKFSERKRSLQPRNDNIIRIGWIGSNGTLQCFSAIREPLESLFSSHNNLELRIVGCTNTELLPSFDNVKYTTFGNYNDDIMVDEILHFDIGIFPAPSDLDDYAVRGAQKAMFYMTGGVPPVCHNVGDATRIIDDCVTGMLCNDLGEWKEKLDILVRSNALRKGIGRRARESIIHERTFSHVFRTMEEAFDIVKYELKRSS